MENTSQPNKKLFIGALAVVGITIIFILVSILTSSLTKQKNSLTKQQTAENSQQGTSNNSNQNLLASPRPSQLDSWTTFKTSEFSISYPSSWKIEELKFSNGEGGISIHPAVQTSANPSFLITNSRSSSSLSAVESQKAYLSLGFSSNSVLIDKIQAIKLSGTIPPKSAGSYTRVILAKHIYLIHGGSDYLLKYSYIDKAINQSFEATFEKMISTFRFVR